MGSASNYLEKALLDHVFGNASLTAPAIALALFDDEPTGDYATGTMVYSELPNSNGYARTAIAAWDAAVIYSKGVSFTQNSAQVLLPEATPASWPSASHYGLFDALTHGGGNLLFYGELTQATLVLTAKKYYVNPGHIQVGLNGYTPSRQGQSGTGSFSNYLEKALLDHVFGVATYPQPTISMALLTARPLGDNTVNVMTYDELPEEKGYARTLVPTWDVATIESSAGPHIIGHGTTQNTLAIIFPVATGQWNAQTHFALFDSSSHNDGNMLCWGALTGTYLDRVEKDDVFTIAAGDIDIYLD